jgi:hypothetical protein
MRLLAFLLLGSLVFGLAFPAAIMLIGLFALLVFAAAIFGLLRGGSFRIYTSQNAHRHAADSKHGKATLDDPEVIDMKDHYEHGNYADQDDFEEEGEIVELPATALRKEDDSGKKPKDGAPADSGD